MADIELDLFSGRPNPRWRLTPAEAQQLKERVAALPPARVERRPPPALGYRGVTVITEEASLSVGHGFVSIGGATHADDGRQLERWLLETGKGRIDDAIWRAARDALG